MRENVLGFLGRRYKKGQKRSSTEMQEESQQNITKPKPITACLCPAPPWNHSTRSLNPIGQHFYLGGEVTWGRTLTPSESGSNWRVMESALKQDVKANRLRSSVGQEHTHEVSAFICKAPCCVCARGPLHTHTLMHTLQYRLVESSLDPVRSHGFPSSSAPHIPASGSWLKRQYLEFSRQGRHCSMGTHT